MVKTDMLIDSIRTYLERYQISKSYNLLNISKTKDKNIPFVRCINEYLQPDEGWQKAIGSNGVRNMEKCFLINQYMERKYNMPSIYGDCYNCYKRCISRHLMEGGDFVLTPRQRKKRLK